MLEDAHDRQFSELVHERVIGDHREIDPQQIALDPQGNAFLAAKGGPNISDKTVPARRPGDEQVQLKVRGFELAAVFH